MSNKIENPKLINLTLLSRFKSKIDELLNNKVNKTDISSYENLGISKPDGSTILVSEDGVLSSVGNSSSVSSLSDLTDVNITDVTNGQGLVWNEESAMWINGEVSSDTSVNMIDGRFYYVVESASIGGDDASIKVSKYLSKTNALVEQNTYLYTVAKNTPIIIDNIMRLSYADIEDQTWCLMSLSNLVNISTGDTYGLGTYINTWNWSVEYSVNLKEQSVNISTNGTLKPWLYDSENEVVIGVYDGKPLYRKMYLITPTMDAWTEIVYESDIDIIRFYGYIQTNIGGKIPLNYVQLEDDGRYYVRIMTTAQSKNQNEYTNRITQYTESTDANLFVNEVITLEYTKTTDAEGSGEGLTPYGVGGGSSLVNYSTEEQVIGTWIDGKPLYQKTIIAEITEVGNIALADISDLSLDMLIVANNTMVGDGVYIPNGYKTEQEDIYFSVYARKGDNTLRAVVSPETYVGYTVYTTIQYTKTTDSTT